MKLNIVEEIRQLVDEKKPYKEILCCIVKMAEEFVCDRCDYQTDLRFNFKRHLLKKVPCPPIKSNISPAEILKKLIVEKDLKCPDCDCTYSSRSGLYLHRKKHHEQQPEETFPQETLPSSSEPETTSREIRLQSEVDELKEEIRKMKEEFAKLSTINVTNNNVTNNNIINNNITIQIKDFEFENRSCLNDSAMKEYIKDKELENIVRDLHMNEEYPENFNVRIKNINRNLMEYYSDGKWNVEEMDEMLRNVIHNSRRIALEFYNSKMKQKETIDRWFDALYHEDDSKIKPLKRKLVLLFIQNKDLLLSK